MTRGEKNNNPGNLDRDGTHWQGMAYDQSGDPRFVVFQSAEWGIRALAEVLLTYYRKHALNTVQSIIDRWAPPSENDTAAYIADICSRLGVAATQVIDLTQPDVLKTLTEAIIKHENGGCIYSDDTLTAGVQMALA